MKDFFSGLISEYIGWGWLILGVLAGMTVAGGIGGTIDNFGIGFVIGLIVCVGICVIGAVRKSRYR